MNCIDRTELEGFVKAKLAPERMLAVDEHVTGCAKCKADVMGLSARADFGAALVGANDCPEYEELSAYIDKALDAKRAESIRLHANLCELCAKDIEKISELRSHAALREKIVVKPGMTRQRSRGALGYWKHALAAVSLAGIAALAVIFGNFGGSAVSTTHVVALKPSAPVANRATEKPKTPTVAQVQPKKAPVVVASNPKPAPVAAPVLRDGGYSVVRKDGKMVIAKSDGTSVRTALEARLDEKLRTGRIRPAKPVMMAMASVNMRGDGTGYDVPPTAPKQIAPLRKVVLSTRPTFSWSAVNLAESYRIRVYDESSNLVIDQIVKKNSFTPAKPLARGQVYKWRIGVRFGETDQWAESAAVKFAVLSNDDLASIKRAQSELPGSHLALGTAYESAGLYEEAAAEYRALRRDNPNSDLAKKMLYGVAKR